MSTIEAIILGIIQGITEFLPVSSSGHLMLGQALLGMKNLDEYIVFDLACHMGTLLAIFIIFYKQIKETLLSNRTRFLQVVLGTLPLFPLVLILKPIKALFNQPEYLGGFFLLTAALLYVGMKLGSVKPQETLQKHRWRDPLVVGVFQAVAIMPGVSRSGSTISGARLLGWTPQEAVTFSFLLAIPAILGGTTLELLQLAMQKHPQSNIGMIQYASGFFSSFIVGSGALLLLMRLALKGQFMYFVWYCLLLGVGTLFYFNFMY